MATAKIEKHSSSIVGMDGSAGTYVYFVTQAGQLRRYTISGGALVDICRFVPPVKCLATDNTTIYYSMGQGRLMSYTISGGVHSQHLKFDAEITSLSLRSAVLYIGLSDGSVYLHS